MRMKGIRLQLLKRRERELEADGSRDCFLLYLANLASQRGIN
jgi:hypothetical protein